MTTTSRQILTVEEAAKQLRIGRNLCYRMIAENRLPSIRLGKRILIPQFGIDRMLAGDDGDGRQAAA